jgi:hypothetical protein
LWHWPILLFAGLTFEPSPTVRIGLIAVAMACAAATYYFVEVPIRRNVRIDAARRPYVLGAAVAALLIWMMPLQAIIRSGGWGQRFGPEVTRFLSENPTHLKTPGLCRAGGRLWSGSRSGCVIGDPDAAEATFVLWGDSHGRMVAPAIAAWAKSKGLKGYVIGRGGCPPLITVAGSPWHAKSKCMDAMRPALALADNPAIKLVIIVGRWARYVEGTLKDEEPTDELMLGDDFPKVLTATIKRVAAPRRRIVLMGPVPEPAVNVPRKVTRALINGQPTELSIPLAEFEKRNARVLRALEQVAGLDGIRIIYPHRAFCDESRCVAAEGGKAFYVDDNHLSPNGVARIDGLIGTIFDDAPALAQQSSAKP